MSYEIFYIYVAIIEHDGFKAQIVLPWASEAIHIGSGIHLTIIPSVFIDSLLSGSNLMAPFILSLTHLVFNDIRLVINLLHLLQIDR